MTLLRRMLLPLTPLYRAGLRWREQRLISGMERIQTLPFPVLSIGNLSTGGSGKTPLAIALARGLAMRGLDVRVLSRGYGRTGDAPARVLANGTAEDFGDEPLLIARETGAPVYVAAQRYRAGLLAWNESPPARVVGILDDGFQHRQLHRDIDILLLNREDWDDWLLPAGNLREPRDAAARADVIAIPPDDPSLESEIREWAKATNWAGELWRIRRVMEIPEQAGPVLAFCGIARPAQFFEGLERAGVQITGRVALRDHHPYTEGDLRRLDEEARETGATGLITTRKDMVRLPAFRWSLPVLAAGLRCEIEDESAALDWLEGQIKAARSAAVTPAAPAHISP